MNVPLFSVYGLQEEGFKLKKNADFLNNNHLISGNKLNNKTGKPLSLIGGPEARPAVDWIYPWH